LAKSVGGVVVDIARPIGGNKQLRAVVGHADRPSARHGANQRGHVGVVNLKKLGARHHKTHIIVGRKRPQPTNWAIAHRGQKRQAWAAL